MHHVFSAIYLIKLMPWASKTYKLYTKKLGKVTA